jgi:hypothetical protein
MIRWKWMPGFLYQTNGTGGGKEQDSKRQKERERVCERQSVAGQEKKRWQ